jgi:hypothetical protein
MSVFTHFSVAKYALSQVNIPEVSKESIQDKGKEVTINL